jgi:hypothetical protein
MAVAGVRITTNLDLVEMPAIAYKDIREAVGGTIQHIALRGAFKGLALYIHDEGKLIGLPFNDIATAIWEASYGKTDVILGDVVLVSNKTDDEGNELPLSESEVEAFLKATEQAVLAYASN